MTRRRIGQEWLTVGDVQASKGSSLGEVSALMDWAEIDRLLAVISASAKGERGWPPLALFRAALVHRGLDRALFEAVTRQLDARSVVVRTGTLVDATLIPSASIRHDGEARWAGHRRRKPMHGYKAHVATDQG